MPHKSSTGVTPVSVSLGAGGLTGVFLPQLVTIIAKVKTNSNVISFLINNIYFLKAFSILTIRCLTFIVAVPP